MVNYIFNSMGTTISIEIRDEKTSELDKVIDKVKLRFNTLDNIFSTYKKNSFITKLNKGTVTLKDSNEAKHIFRLAERLHESTKHYFDIRTPDGYIDPSGIVKSYAIAEAGNILQKANYYNWCLNCGGDILISDQSQQGWPIGILDPDDKGKLLADIKLNNKMKAIATSGFSERGAHIWNTVNTEKSDVLQATVISKNIILADVWATTIVSAGSKSLTWEHNSNFEALLVLQDRSLLATSGYRDLI